MRTSGGTSASNDLLLNAFGSGKVAIGTSKVSANATLDVFGNAIITGSLTVTAGITGSLNGTATTASYIDPTFISASAAASGFGSGGTGGISQGKVVAIATGIANLF